MVLITGIIGDTDGSSRQFVCFFWGGGKTKNSADLAHYILGMHLGFEVSIQFRRDFGILKNIMERK